jgi:ribosomal protein S18 acetylase RimI-like enzyme
VGELVYTNVTPDRAEDMVELELLCFPSVARDDLMTIEGVHLQAELFPQGSFIVLDDDRLVGMASGVLIDFDLSRPQHRMGVVVGHEGVGNHDPEGPWYYGTDIAVHPDYRGQGIARRLYELRKQLVVDLGRRGIVAGGVIPGYADHKDQMTAQEYVDRVAAGELFDATLSVQIANGFEVHGVIENYVDDQSTDGWASFIVWFNPNVPRDM